MYSESDIEAAIAAGAMTPEAAAALRAHAGAKNSAPMVDEENIRLVTSFNDIFVTIASILVLMAAFRIGVSIQGLGVALALEAATAWLLAEFFTRKRHMALPSIVLLISFVCSVFGAALAFSGSAESPGLLVSFVGNNGGAAINIAVCAAIAAGGAYLHWRRFYVPITVAAGTCALVGMIIAIVASVLPKQGPILLMLCLAGGLAVFAFAMWWDMSDRDRKTRKSDVAFWLHLAAAPMIVHPIFWLLGLLEGRGADPVHAAIVIIVYLLFGVIALAIDRRALLVSALFYVLYALTALVHRFGAVNLDFAITAFLIGSALLLLSAFWHPARVKIVGWLPAEWQARLPSLSR